MVESGFAVARAATTENRALRWFRKLRIGGRARDAWWAILHRFHPSHRYHVIKTGLRPGYYDTDIRMLESWMALLVEHVEIGEEGEAKLAEGIECLKQDRAEALAAGEDWRAPSDGQIECDEEALSVYRWWKHERPALWAKHEEYFNGYFQRSRAEREAGALKHHEDEEALHDVDQVMLARLLKIRRGLWT